MPREGMAGLCLPAAVSSPFSSSSCSVPSPSRFGFSPSRPSFSESVMDRTVRMAEPIILRWNPADTTTGAAVARVTSLFYESRREAREFVKTVTHLQKAMQFLAEENSGSDKLAQGQNLMQIAMKRLQKEFYQILSMNRAHLDPESVSTRSRSSTGSSATSDFEDDDDDDEIRGGAADAPISDVSLALAMADLRMIAECMISTGYAKECLKIYIIIRKSIVDEGIYKLGVEKLTSSQIHKMDWEALDLRINNYWLGAVRNAVTTLFNGESILCHHVFASSDSIRESCFSEIVKDGAMLLFGFPELVAKHSQKSPPEKVFGALDMYTEISNHWPEIDSIFNYAATVPIKSQALTSLSKLAEFVRAALDEFEVTILKDSSKSPVAGAGIHPLTVDAMNYLSIISDYDNLLAEILADSPPPSKKSLPESYFGFSDPGETQAPAAISMKMAWLVIVLLCKLDTKAKYYKDVSLAYLFLANNLQYVVASVQTSNLKYLLGTEWLAKHEAKVKQFASNYERLGWSHVIESLPSYLTATETSPEKVKEMFKKFNTLFDQAYRKQSLCVVPDKTLRDYIKNSIARRIIRLYKDFYSAHRHTVANGRHVAAVVRYAPEDLRRHLSDMFFGDDDVSDNFLAPRSPLRGSVHNA
ncbi:exocyst complex component EXO70H1-like [Andrographis paniculata]|uniref:exocyst complex component EXO70H1-like n=1 Tax=Andrographis paniculata TaxID=175694 RepID=UPI0021E984CE|nr:exocyst complex component EXO70H1-like [Andrographis paniculata]